MQNPSSSLGGDRQFIEWPSACHQHLHQCDHASRDGRSGCALPPIARRRFGGRVDGANRTNSHATRSRRRIGRLEHGRRIHAAARCREVLQSSRYQCGRRPLCMMIRQLSFRSKPIQRIFALHCGQHGFFASAVIASTDSAAAGGRAAADSSGATAAASNARHSAR